MVLEHMRNPVASGHLLSIVSSAKEAEKAIQFLQAPYSLRFMEEAAHLIVSCFKAGGKILVAGNGGSLCDALHCAEELTGLFRRPRDPLPAIALADPGHLTCVANDIGFDQVFARSVKALGKPGDVLLLLTTSGNSENLIQAARIAEEKEMFSVAFLGKSGGKLKGLCTLEWIVEGFSYSDRIQEAHMAALHIIIEAVENLYFGSCAL